MTAPNGLLMYGQGGSYNAVDDRSMVSVLARFHLGVARAPTLTAGTGLNVNVGSFAAVVDCGDGTSAVLLSLTPVTVTPAAGGSAARTDVLWVDLDVQAGTWQLNLLNPTAIIGRQGVEIGRITVPANANAASAFTFAPAAVTGGFGQHVLGMRVSATTSATGFITLTHNLGRTPVAVVGTMYSPTTAGANIITEITADTFTGTTVRVRCLHNTGEQAVSMAVSFSLILIG